MRLWIGLAAAAVALGGCSGDETKTDTDETDDTGIAADTDTDTDTDIDVDLDPTYDADIEPIFMSSCAGIGCHTGGGMSGGLSLDGAYITLTTQSNAASGLLYIDAGSPDDSYLWAKLIGTQDAVGGGGSQMPIGAPLTQADLDLIEAWILDGAPQ